MTAQQWCEVCDTPRDLADLLEVTDVRSGAVHYVCRPMATGGTCFREGVGSVFTHRIADAKVQRIASPHTTPPRRNE